MAFTWLDSPEMQSLSDTVNALHNTIKHVFSNHIFTYGIVLRLFHFIPSWTCSPCFSVSHQQSQMMINVRVSASPGVIRTRQMANQCNKTTSECVSDVHLCSFRGSCVISWKQCGSLRSWAKHFSLWIRGWFQQFEAVSQWCTEPSVSHFLSLCVCALVQMRQAIAARAGVQLEKHPRRTEAWINDVETRTSS